MGDLAGVLQRAARSAAAHDAEDGDGLGLEVSWLHEVGALTGALPQSISGRAEWSDDPLAVAKVLHDVGRASLPLGRLFEGHINALQLVGLYGDHSLRKRCELSVMDGRLLGVWGADGPAPVYAERTADGFRLHGAKVFCSGLGVVGLAVISVSLEGSTHLMSVGVDDPARMDHSQWRVSGMRATRSGGEDFDGVETPADALMGGPGEYFIEPYFLGGMYRICAVQAGGLQALLDAFVASIRKRPRASEFLSHHRIGAVASRVFMSQAVTEQLARGLAAENEPATIARDSVLGREAVERCIVEALEIVERTVGTEAHREGASISLLRRDLSFYARQAAVDERLAEVGRTISSVKLQR